MSLPQLDRLMHENVVIVTDARKLPESVPESVPESMKGSFYNIEKCHFVGVKVDMVNPGEARAMSNDHVIRPSSEPATPIRQR